MPNTADPAGGHTDPPAAESSTYPFNTAASTAHSPSDGVAQYAADGLLGLSVQHYPMVGISVVVVEGALDLLTVPLLERRVREQLVAKPAHLILDLESVRFVGASGLSCLLRACELAQASGAQLHLAGLITRVVQRAVYITGLLGLFSAYPTLIHAVIDLADRVGATTPDPVMLPPAWIALWCAEGDTWTLELRRWEGDTRLGTPADTIDSEVPVTLPVPDTVAPKLLAARGLWLFRDVFPRSSTGSRHRIGYVSADAQLITLADLMRDDATRAGVHPMMLAVWKMAGFSTATATGWIRAGCLFPR